MIRTEWLGKLFIQKLMQESWKVAVLLYWEIVSFLKDTEREHFCHLSWSSVLDQEQQDFASRSACFLPETNIHPFFFDKAVKVVLVCIEKTLSACDLFYQVKGASVYMASTASAGGICYGAHEVLGNFEDSY